MYKKGRKTRRKSRKMSRGAPMVSKRKLSAGKGFSPKEETYRVKVGSGNDGEDLNA